MLRNRSDNALNILSLSGREANFLDAHKIGFNKIICTNRRMITVYDESEQNDERSVATKVQSRQKSWYHNLLYCYHAYFYIHKFWQG